MDISNADTQSLTLPAPAFRVWEPPRLPRRSHRWWAVPLASIGLLIGAAVMVSSLFFVDRFAEAPGDANPVNKRLAVSAVPVYPAEGEILFVTVAGPQLTGLQATVGWLDPDVAEQNRVERFGKRTPEEERRVNIRAMRSAKDDAPYVALTRLGYPTERRPGPVVIDFVYCVEVASDNRTCSVEFPADAFLDAGDRFISVDGRDIVTAGDLDAALRGKRAGDKVAVVVERAGAEEGDTESGMVELSADPDDPERVIFGIRLGDTTEVELPFAVDISTGAIGGPSAGLAFTLSVLDYLTPGELTGGRKVAVTGTIDVDGKVGPIGGLHQKAVAVKQAGGVAFLVPADQSAEELADARRVLGAERVFPVADLDEALEVLRQLGGNVSELGTPGAGYVAS